VVPKKENELVAQRNVTSYRMCIDFRKLNKPTHKDRYPLSFIDQMLERLPSIHIFSILMVILVSLKFMCRKIIKKILLLLVPFVRFL
jgi:hypothetical protein